MAEDLEKNKRMNTELARHLDFKYYSTRHAGFGGKLGDPGFHLADAQCPLAMLIEKPYELLNVHYAAIDFTRLEQYGVPDPIAATAEDGDVSLATRSSLPRNAGGPSHVPHTSSGASVRFLNRGRETIGGG